MNTQAYGHKMIVHLAAMALVIGGVFGLRAHTVEARFTPESPLLVTTRASYRYCVATSAALEGQSAAARQNVAQSMAAVRQHPEWAKAYGNTQPKPEACPRITNLPTARINPNNSWGIGPGLTTNPGPWRTVVVVLDDATADVVLGTGTNAELMPYELMRQSDHVLDTATQAVLVRESALDDPEFINRDLTVAVGLEPLQKPLPPQGEPSTK
jgi:hypothetical protein